LVTDFGKAAFPKSGRFFLTSKLKPDKVKIMITLVAYQFEMTMNTMEQMAS